MNKPANVFPLIFSGLGITFLGLMSFKYYVNPYLAQRDRERSQKFADSLWKMQQQQKAKDESESQ